MSAAALALDHVTLSLGGRVVLDDLSLDVRPGELLALIGPNGSGKTTALRMLTGTLRPQIGRALIDGRPVAGLGRRALPRARRKTGRGRFRQRWVEILARRRRLDVNIPLPNIPLSDCRGAWKR